MTEILLINPNTSEVTTEMMVGLANSGLPDGWTIRGVTASRGAPMIVNAVQLAVATEEVIAIGRREASKVSGIIIGAFADPGLDSLRNEIAIPIAGLCEAAMLEASLGRRRFGVATTTEDLSAAIYEKVAALGLTGLYTGIRLTLGDPVELTSDIDRLDMALEAAVRACVELDQSEAVIIGGGPLAGAASRLAPRFHEPVIQPVAAAVRQLLKSCA